MNKSQRRALLRAAKSKQSTYKPRRDPMDTIPAVTASNKPDGNTEAQAHVKHNEMRRLTVEETDTGITATTVRLPDHVDREEYQALRIELNKAYKAGDKALHAKLAQKHYEMTKG